MPWYTDTVRLSGPNANWTASSSSSHGPDYGPERAIDGIEVDTFSGFFHSNEISTYGWFQLDMGRRHGVRAVDIVNRLDGKNLHQEVNKEVKEFHIDFLALWIS